MVRTAIYFLTATFALAVPAAGENLLTNPDFDADHAGWNIDRGWNPAWSPDDEAGCAGSGAFYLLAQHGGTVIYSTQIEQCLPLPVGAETVSIGGRYRVDSEFVDISLRVAFHDGCTNPPIEDQGVTDTGPPPEVWHTLALDDIAVPAGASAVLFDIHSFSTNTYQIWQDRLYLGVEAPVFRDDFEADSDGTGEPCRWTPLP